MKRIPLSLCVLLFAVPLTALPALAQSPTSGSINGSVTDNTGAYLPGVTVVATGPALMGQQTSVTNEQGQYRFPMLPPGVYRLVYELTGFGRVVREGIRVGIGFNAEVNVPMQLASVQETVTVTGESPVIDTQNTNVQNNFTAEMMKAIPNARDIWSLIAEAPGMTVTRFDVGGSTAGTQTGYSAYGMSGQNRVQIDGVNTTEGTGSAGFYFDYGAFEEIQFGVDSNDASMPSPGVFVNTLLKSGGNSFRGDLYVDYENKHLQFTNIDDRLLRLGVGQGAKILKYFDPNFTFGGPIKRDRFWFFTSLRNQKIVSTVTGFPVENPGQEFGFETELQNGTYKLTYQLSQNNKLSHYIQYGRKLQPSRGAGSTAYRDAITFQDSGSWAGNVEWSSILGPRFVMVTRASSFGYNFPQLAYGINGIVNQDVDFRRVENTTGNTKGGAAANRLDRRRWMGEWSANYFKDNFLGGEHSFKLGWVSEWEYTQDEVFGPRGLYQMTFQSPTGAPDFTTPFRVTIYNRPYTSVDLMTHHGGYINDQIRFGKGVTLNLGLRMDRYNTGYPDQEIRQGPWTSFFYRGVPLSNGYAFPVTPWADLSVPSQWGFVKYPHAFGPRLGVAWDLTRDGNTVLKANWGRYYNNPGTTTSNINPATGTSAVFAWFDCFDSLNVRKVSCSTAGALPGDRMFASDEFGTFVSGSAPGLASTTFDPNIGHPYGDDMSFAVERHLFGGVALRSAFVYKKAENGYTNVELARLGSLYTDRRTAVDPGADGTVGTSDDGTFTYFDIPAGFTLPASQTLRTTRPENRSSAKNIDFTLTKRMSNRWSLVSNFLYTWSYAEDFVQTPNGTMNNPRRTTLWTFKLFGTYQAPWDIIITPLLRHQAGDPLSRVVQPSPAPRAGSTTFPVEPTGSYREDNITIFDTRFERRFRFANRREVALFLDAFNIANSNAAESMDNQSGRRTVDLPSGERVEYQRFMRPTTIIGPRVFRFGVKVGF